MKTLKTKLRFPEGFFWGASTASYQVEGGNLLTNWGVWERSVERIAALQSSGMTAARGLPNFINGVSCDHYHRWRPDFALAKKLGPTATRCGSEPARIMPKKGVVSKHALKHYVSVAKYLRKLGLEPFWTLWHWTIPSWWEDEGGWLAPNALEYFEQYVRVIVTALKPYVKYWLTLNETNCFAYISYAWGVWPPQHNNMAEADCVREVLVQAHKIACRIIKEANPQAKVSIAENIGWQEGKWDDKWNYQFLDAVREEIDFVGVNHYGNNGEVSGDLLSDFGWRLDPTSLATAARRVWKRYHKPILITEHGLADAVDTRRPWFLWESLRHLHEAIEDSVSIFGYLHWSLMDNFEWAEGFFMRFGLVEIDRENNLARKPRPSAYLYRDIIAANGLTPELEATRAAMISLPTGPIKQ